MKKIQKLTVVIVVLFYLMLVEIVMRMMLLTMMSLIILMMMILVFFFRMMKIRKNHYCQMKVKAHRWTVFNYFVHRYDGMALPDGVDLNTVYG